MPADIAILVRDGKEAQAVRNELASRGVRSVYLSDKDSVFAAQEAHDVLAWLKEPQAVQSLPDATLPSLTLIEPPQADVSRYDSLRQSQEDDHVQ